MLTDKKISSQENSTTSRRRFLGNSLKLTALSAFLLPMKKVLGTGSSFLISNTKKPGHEIPDSFFSNSLILNKKTNVVHLPTEKIFTHYPDISADNQRIIDLKGWETGIKAPVHFNKEKSGIILELLALQKLSAGINDKSLAAATNTLAIAFSPIYKNVNGDNPNIYNFRVHDLLLQTIALNNSIPAAKKWSKFQSANGDHDYYTESRIPRRMNWMKSKIEFDAQASYIITNKIKYTDRLKKRAADYKL